MPVFVLLSAVVFFFQLVLLDHGTHGTIQDQNAVGGQIEYLFVCVSAHVLPLALIFLDQLI